MKKITIVFLLLSTSVIGQVSLTENLLLHYKFDGDVKDFSGNGYDGEFSNVTYELGTLNKLDSVAYFNGVNNYINFPNLEELKPKLPVSIALWVKFDNLSNEQSVTFTTDFEENNHSGIWSSLSSKRIAISYGDATGNTTSRNRRSKIGTTELIANKWYHFIFIIRDKLDMDIYINGINDRGLYTGESNNGLGYTSNPGSIGRKDSNTNLPSHYFKGNIDDFMYWDKELSEEEVNALFNNSTLSNIGTKVDYNSKEILIVPNPTKNFFKIKTQNKINSVLIFNSLSKLVLAFKNKQDLYNINNLPSGTYFVKIITNEGVCFKKMMVE